MGSNSDFINLLLPVNSEAGLTLSPNFTVLVSSPCLQGNTLANRLIKGHGLFGLTLEVHAKVHWPQLLLSL